MTDKELRRMSRTELLQMLLTQVEENEQLRTKAADLASQLEQHRITCEDAGSIAEAALRIHNVFDAADQAAREYVQSIQNRFSQLESQCEKMEADARRQAETIVADAQRQAATILEEANARAEEAERTVKNAKAEASELLRKAKAEADEYWLGAKATMETLFSDQ